MEKVVLKKAKCVCIMADFSGKTVEDYAMAWLRLSNITRERPDAIYKIANCRDSNNVYVYCLPKYADSVSDMLTGIVIRHEVKESEIDILSIGKVIDEWECVIGLPEYINDNPDDDMIDLFADMM